MQPRLARLYLLPFRHPVLLAEEIATLAAIAPHRFIMQCGLGHGEREFAAFGINPKQRPSRFEECLNIMRRLWAGETVTHQGRWQVHEARISPTPPQPIEVWIAGSAKPAIERAARLGDGWLAAPGLTPESAKDSLEYYLAMCAKHQRAPGVKAIRRDIYVGETQAQAQDIGGKIVSAGLPRISARSHDCRRCAVRSQRLCGTRADGIHRRHRPQSCAGSRASAGMYTPTEGSQEFGRLKIVGGSDSSVHPRYPGHLPGSCELPGRFM